MKMATKSKPHPFSARRSSPRTRSGTVPEPISSPRTCSRFVPELNSTDDIPSRTPFSSKAITPIVGTQKSVSLSDWWLTKKANEKGLRVTGFESKGGSEVRQFSSGPISIRHDSTTLETCDGITVCVSGLINRTRTLQNGFASEVCNRFLLGFPYQWKDCSEEGFVEEEEKKRFTVSFDDIPVNWLQDVLFTSSSCFKGDILHHVLDSLRGLVCPMSENSDKECDKSDKECEKSDKNSEKSDKECEKSRMDNDDEEEKSVVPSVVGVKTRGMRRREENETATIGKRVHTLSKKRSREKSKGQKFLLN